MTTTLKKKIVTKSSVLASGTQKIYDDWRKVPSGLRSSGMWRGEGLGINTQKEKPRAYFDPDDALDYERVIPLYEKTQTYRLTEPTRSKRILINRFVRRNELFGLTPVNGDHPIFRHTNFLRGGVSDLVYRSFDYKHRGTGIPTRFLWESKPIYADAFYVLAPEKTDWFVIDIDNHKQKKASTEAHLKLVAHLVKVMPDIAKRIGATCVFFDYAQESPRGIHIWVMLGRRWTIGPMHNAVRKILMRLADPIIDASLCKNGLKAMGSLEILPTEGQLIRMFGSHERRVYTTKELLPKNGQFDAESLLAHIESRRIDGDPYERYATLAYARLGNDLHEARPTASVPAPLLSLASTAPTQRSGYIGHIVEACLNGVTEEDSLFETYLCPLASALFWREYHDQPDRARLTQDALVRWIDRKHNGLVSRINTGKRRLVVAQIRHVVKRLPATPPGVRALWAKVVANDISYPHQTVSFSACIDCIVKNPVHVDRQTLKTLPAILKAGGVLPTKGNTYKGSSVSTVSSRSLLPLPPALETSVRTHTQRAEKRKGKFQDRVVTFALRLLNTIGLDGTRTIDGRRMNELAGLGKGRKHILKYKKLLVGAGILEPGWKNTASKAKKLASRYDLTPWALDELKKHWSPPPPTP